MKKVIKLLLMLTAALLLMAPAPIKEKKAASDTQEYYYKWVDEKGSVHVTDTIGNVPAKYQKSLQKIPKATVNKIQTPAEDKTSGQAPVTPINTGNEVQREQLTNTWKTRIDANKKDRDELVKEMESKRKELAALQANTPYYFNITYAEKRKREASLGAQINTLIKKIGTLDRELEKMQDTAVREGVNPRLVQ